MEKEELRSIFLTAVANALSPEAHAKLQEISTDSILRMSDHRNGKIAYDKASPAPDGEPGDVVVHPRRVSFSKFIKDRYFEGAGGSPWRVWVNNFDIWQDKLDEIQNALNDIVWPQETVQDNPDDGDGPFDD